MIATSTIVTILGGAPGVLACVASAPRIAGGLQRHARDAGPCVLS